MNYLHSPSCCLHEGKIHIAFYAGDKECVNQKVLIYRREKANTFTLIKKLPTDSGNPVLLSMGGKLFCFFSMFTQPMKGNVFHLWRTTYTAVTQVESDDAKNTYTLSTYNCPRTNAVDVGGSLLLGTYDEQMEIPMLFILNNGSSAAVRVPMPELSRCIQPTFARIKCLDDKEKLHVLCRNFDRNDLGYVPYGILHMGPNNLFVKSRLRSNIPNHNESIVAINDENGTPLIVFNKYRKRKDLTLGILEYNEEGILVSKDLLKINEEPNASYPNMCFNSRGQLQITFTSYEQKKNNNKICLATVSKKYDNVLSKEYITAEDIKDID